MPGFCHEDRSKESPPGLSVQRDYELAQTAINYPYNCILESGIKDGAKDVLDTLFSEPERIPGENPLKLAHGMSLVAFALVQTRRLERHRSPQQTVKYLRSVFTPPDD
jgi:hypothetical protein